MCYKKLKVWIFFVYLKSIQHCNISNPDSDTYGRKYAYVDDTLHFRIEPASTPLPLPNCSQRQLYLEAWRIYYYIKWCEDRHCWALNLEFSLPVFISFMLQCYLIHCLTDYLRGYYLAIPVNTVPPSLICNVWRGSFSGLKQPGLCVNHPPTCCCEVKHEYNYTSTPLLCLHGMQRGEFFPTHFILTLRLLMSYTYMELLVKPEMLTSYIYGPTFRNAETVSFYLLHNVSTLNQCREVSCVTFVCKHFAS